LLRVIAASFGDLPHSLNLSQSEIWEGSAGPPARKRHPVIGRSSCRGHDASSRCVRRVNGVRRKPVTSFPHQAATPVDGRTFEGHWGPPSPPSVGATTRDEQLTVCPDMRSGGSNGLRAHFTRATCPCSPQYRPAGCRSGEQTSRSRQSGTGISAPYRAAISAGSGARPDASSPCTKQSTDVGAGSVAERHRRAGVGFHDD
jgi:hypothetical protein